MKHVWNRRFVRPAAIAVGVIIALVSCGTPVFTEPAGGEPPAPSVTSTTTAATVEPPASGTPGPTPEPADTEAPQAEEPQATQTPAATSTPARREAEVVEVIDGDTIRVEVRGEVETVRYIGIDTPETRHPERPVERMGPEATEANRELVGGETVLLERDVSETDQYGRLLRYVYLPSAHRYTRPPDPSSCDADARAPTDRRSGNRDPRPAADRAASGRGGHRHRLL